MSLRLLYLAFRRTTEWLALLAGGRIRAGHARHRPGSGLGRAVPLCVGDLVRGDSVSERRERPALVTKARQCPQDSGANGRQLGRQRQLSDWEGARRICPAGAARVESAAPFEGPRLRVVEILGPTIAPRDRALVDQAHCAGRGGRLTVRSSPADADELAQLT